MLSKITNQRVKQLSILMASLLYAGTLWAEVRQYAIQIPAQRLDLALQSLAQQSGAQILFVTNIVSGKTSTALSGQLTVEQALEHLLKGQNLEIKKLADNKYSVVQSAEPSSMHLQPDNVEPSAEVSQLPVLLVSATDSLSDQSKNNYTVSRSSSATKLDLALKDTPQSITIITQKQIEEQGLTDVNKILEVTPGVTVSNFGVPGAGRVTYYSRGYEINNVMVDGAPTLIGGDDRGMELLAGYDTIIYDRVEVTRGSTGLSTGTGDPSASINFVRKRPGKTAERNIKLGWGTWGKERVELDLSQPFTKGGRLRGRFVAAYEQGNSYIDRIKQESKILYGIVEADLWDKTTVAVGGTWFDKDVDDATPHGSALGASSSMRVNSGILDRGQGWNAATDWSYSHMRNWNAFLTVDHQFNDNWKLSTNYQYTKNTPDRRYGIVGVDWYNEAYNMASLTIGREKYESQTQNLDITLLGKFDLFGREAQIATGFNGYQARRTEPLWAGYWYQTCRVGTQSSTNCVSLDNWTGDVPYPKNNSTSSIRQGGVYPLDHYNAYYKYDEQQYGYFLSSKFEPLERLKVILGARYNHYQIERDYYLNEKWNPSYYYYYEPDDEVVPYAGLVYDLTPSTTAYASYTGIYKTQLEKDINDEFLPFIEGNSYEIGLKSALFDDRLNLHTAVFYVLEENVAYQMSDVPRDPETGQQYECTSIDGNYCDIHYANDGPEISGFEFTLQGQLTPKWMINAGYTYLHVNTQEGRERSSGESMDGGDYSYERPKHAITLSTSYLASDRLTLGGNLRWKSKTAQGLRYCYTQGNGVRTCRDSTTQINNIMKNQGSFMVVDLMGRYQINPHLVLGLNISNLFDKVYLVNDLGSLYGASRSGTLSLAFKF